MGPPKGHRPSWKESGLREGATEVTSELDFEKQAGTGQKHKGGKPRQKEQEKQREQPGQREHQCEGRGHGSVWLE